MCVILAQFPGLAVSESAVSQNKGGVIKFNFIILLFIFENNSKTQVTLRNNYRVYDAFFHAT